MKKEDAYRDKSGCYVAFEYDGHVFVMTQKKGRPDGEHWAWPFSFCPISSDTEFSVQFTTVEEATAAVKKIWLKVIYTQEWEVLENKDVNTFCVDKLQWKEWHEYQEVLRHKAPFAAIAIENRVYKDTYSTALSDGNAWVFSTGVERLFKHPVQATHKIDQLLLAIRQYPDMKLFDTAEERTEWSLKYLEEYAAIPEPTPVAKEQEVVPIGSIIDPMGESWNPDKQVYCCAACAGEIYYPTWGKGSSCTFQSNSGSVLRHADGSMVTGQNTYRSLCQAVVKSGAIDMYVCYTQSREGYELFIKAHISKEKQQELLQELPGVDMTEQQEPELVVAPHTHTVTAVLPATAPPDSTTELLPVGLTNTPQNSCIVHAFESQGTPKLRPVEIAPEPEFVAAAVVIGEKIFRSFPTDVMTQDEWKFIDLKSCQPLRMHEGNELAEDLSLDITAPTLAGLIAAAEERGFKVAKFTSEANYRRWIAVQIPTPVVNTKSYTVVDSDGQSTGWSTCDIPEHRKVSPVLSSAFNIKASSDAPPIIETDSIKTMESGNFGLQNWYSRIETDSIKTMKSGVTPQPSRSRIGKIVVRPYEYVYDGPQQMGATFVSRYRIDDEVWVRVGDTIAKMKVVGIFVSSCKGKVSYLYDLDNSQIAVSNKFQDEVYDTLFDLISAMTSISIEELIAAAKEVI